jgi:hypothetical protein
MSSEADQRSLLFVSRLHHGVALEALFRLVKLYFGLWESLRPHNPRQECLQRSSANNVRSEELLNAIANDPVFARVVKELWVFCYTESGLDIKCVSATVHLSKIGTNFTRHRCSAVNRRHASSSPPSKLWLVRYLPPSASLCRPRLVCTSASCYRASE